MIIGITGTDGAGKGTAVEYLKTKGFIHYSAREFLVEEIKKRDLPMSRNQMRLMGNEFREKYGNEFIVKRALEIIDKEGVEKAIIESIRATGEAEYLIQEGGVLLSVDAKPEIRYERVQSRQSESDKISFKEFVEYEEVEKDDGLKNGLNKAAVMKMADFTILNDGRVEELFEQVEQVLKDLEL